MATIASIKPEALTQALHERAETIGCDQETGDTVAANKWAGLLLNLPREYGVKHAIVIETCRGNRKAETFSHKTSALARWRKLVAKYDIFTQERDDAQDQVPQA